MPHPPPLEYRTPAHAKSLAPLASIAAVGGTLYAAVIGALAFGMTGAGHGWMSGTISCLGLLLIPVAAVCVVFRRTSFGGGGTIVTFLAGVGIDTMLFVATRNEGVEYLDHVRHALPDVFLTWAVLWSAWQLVLLAFVVVQIRRPWPTSTSQM